MENKLPKIKRGLPQVLVGSAVTLFSLERFASSTRADALNVIESYPLTCVQEFREHVQLILDESVNFEQFFQAFALLCQNNPTLAKHFDLSEVELNFVFDKFAHVILSALSAASIFFSTFENETLPYTSLLIASIISLNGWAKFFSVTTNQYGISKGPAIDFLSDSKVSLVVRLKFARILGFDLSYNEPLRFLDKIYNPDINLDYELLLRILEKNSNFFRAVNSPLFSSTNSFDNLAICFYYSAIQIIHTKSVLAKQVEILLEYYLNYKISDLRFASCDGLSNLLYYCPNYIERVCEIYSNPSGLIASTRSQCLIDSKPFELSDSSVYFYLKESDLNFDTARMPDEILFNLGFVCHKFFGAPNFFMMDGINLEDFSSSQIARLKSEFVDYLNVFSKLDKIIRFVSPSFLRFLVDISAESSELQILKSVVYSTLGSCYDLGSSEFHLRSAHGVKQYIRHNLELTESVSEFEFFIGQFFMSYSQLLACYKMEEIFEEDVFNMISNFDFDLFTLSFFEKHSDLLIDGNFFTFIFAKTCNAAEVLDKSLEEVVEREEFDLIFLNSKMKKSHNYGFYSLKYENYDLSQLNDIIGNFSNEAFWEVMEIDSFRDRFLETLLASKNSIDLIGFDFVRFQKLFSEPKSREFLYASVLKNSDSPMLDKFNFDELFVQLNTVSNLGFVLALKLDPKRFAEFFLEIPKHFSLNEVDQNFLYLSLFIYAPEKIAFLKGLITPNLDLLDLNLMSVDVFDRLLGDDVFMQVNSKSKIIKFISSHPTYAAVSSEILLDNSFDEVDNYSDLIQVYYQNVNFSRETNFQNLYLRLLQTVDSLDPKVFFASCDKETLNKLLYLNLSYFVIQNFSYLNSDMQKHVYEYLNLVENLSDRFIKDLDARDLDFHFWNNLSSLSLRFVSFFISKADSSIFDGQDVFARNLYVKCLKYVLDSDRDLFSESLVGFVEEKSLLSDLDYSFFDETCFLKVFKILNLTRMPAVERAFYRSSLVGIQKGKLEFDKLYEFRNQLLAHSYLMQAGVDNSNSKSTASNLDADQDRTILDPEFIRNLFENSSVDDLVEQICALQTLDMPNLRKNSNIVWFYVADILRYKFDQELVSRNVSVLRQQIRPLVMQYFPLIGKLQFLLVDRSDFVKSYYDLVIENYELISDLVDDDFFSRLETSQIKPNNYLDLFDILNDVNAIRVQFHMEFFEYIVDRCQDEYEIKLALNTFHLKTHQSAALLILFCIKRDYYQYILRLVGSSLSGRDLFRLRNANPKIQWLYSMIGELTPELLLLALYLDGKIDMQESISDICDFEISVEAVEQNIKKVSGFLKYPSEKIKFENTFQKYLFAVVNGFFRTHYSSGINFSDFLDNATSVDDSLVEVNPEFEVFDFEVDYYTNVRNLNVPPPTNEYMSLIGSIEKIQFEGFSNLSKFLDNLKRRFDLLLFPSDFSLEKICAGINDITSLFDQMAPFVGSTFYIQMLELNGFDSWTLDEIRNIPNKKLKSQSAKTLQMRDLVLNLRFVFVELVVAEIYCQRFELSLEEKYIAGLDPKLVSLIEGKTKKPIIHLLEELSELSFAKLNDFVKINELPKHVIGWVSNYQMFMRLDILEILNKDLDIGLKMVTLSVMKTLFFVEKGYFDIVEEACKLDLFSENNDSSSQIEYEVWLRFAEKLKGFVQDDIVSAVEDPLKLKTLKRVLGANVLDDIAPPKREGHQLRSLRAEPLRNVYMELSGFNVDACWAHRFLSKSMAESHENVLFYKFSEADSETGGLIQRGGTLIIESESTNREKIWVVRGMNPRDDMQPNFDSDSLVFSFLKSLQKLAVGAGAKLCVIMDDSHASSTNRDWVRKSYDNLKLKQVDIYDQKSVVFNGYYETAGNVFEVIAYPEEN